ncbi:guanylate-binding protein 1-like isoform X2 [Lethenteron reissneri]|uniref:guanylate-binding protein 1-like isoform X2 n=1 Tax=Lethenteron reissneri TaxID=7753 RepID=UPI002AB62841|nr:guanylate-binding protein 1-like isoform X2 [Lethenteron reissneri]
MSSPYPPRPLPFIMTDEYSKFYVNKETADLLGKIDKPVVVVAIVGKYRTGKSFLMNRLASTTTGVVTPKEDKTTKVVTKSEPGDQVNKDEDAYKKTSDIMRDWKNKEQENSLSQKTTTPVSPKVPSKMQRPKSMGDSPTPVPVPRVRRSIVRKPQSSDSMGDSPTPVPVPRVRRSIVRKPQSSDSMGDSPTPVPVPRVRRSIAHKPQSSESMGDSPTPVPMPRVVPSIAPKPQRSESISCPGYNRNPGVSLSGGGFAVGHAVQSKTKGIWAWPIPHPANKDNCLLLLDTEGLGDPEKADEEHDIWLFIMAVLLCNVLVYNTEKSLDNTGLEQLRYVKNMSEHVRSQISPEDEKPSVMESHLPSLVVCVRDCALKLEWDGKSCTPDEYMEKCFQVRRSNSPENEEFNRERDLMCAYFKKRKCFIFPMPAHPDDMDQLENKLSKTFLKVAEEFTSHIYQIIKYKNIDGVILTGQLFLQVAELYVQAHRSGDMVCIEGARQYVVLFANMQAMEDAKGVYQREMETLTNKLPVEYKQLQRHQEECTKKAMALFYRCSVLDCIHEFETELLRFTLETFEKMEKKNTEQSYKLSERRLRELFQHVNEMDKEFMQPGGYQRYKAAMQKLDEEYHATQGLGEEKDKAYKDFMEKSKDRGQSILMVDKTLTQVQQE